MIAKFLNAKHWQIFVLLFGIPLAIHILFVSLLFRDLSGSTPSLAMSLSYISLIYPIIAIVFIGGYFGWVWSVSMGLLNKVPSTIDMKMKNFKIFFTIPLLYVTFVISLILFTVNYNYDILAPEFLDSAKYIVLIIVPIHLFSIFCSLYNIYHVAKTIKTAELQRKLKFSDFVEEFLLILIFPIGIWFIQPRVNALYNSGTLVDDNISG